jgi:hypothetical protein
VVFFSKSQGQLDGYNKYDKEVEVATWKCKWYEAPMRMNFIEVI